MKLTAVYTDNGKTVALTPAACEYAEGPVVTCSRRMREQIALLEDAALAEQRVIIFGEPGTQKQWYAEYAHGLSGRKDRPYMRFDCAATPAYRCEEVLFGATRGSGFDRWDQKGLLEAADGGTLLLDEISALPMFLYEKVERFLETGTMVRQGSREEISSDVRLLATCSKDLRDLVSRGAETVAFVQRLAPIHIHIPPLRERPEDVALLTLRYLQEANLRSGSEKRMGSALFREILAYSWPGNERELRNFVAQLVMTAEEDVLEDPSMIRSAAQLSAPVQAEEVQEWGDDMGSEKSLKEMVREYETMLIYQSIRKYGSLRKAAKALQIAPSALSRKLSAAREKE